MKTDEVRARIEDEVAEWLRQEAAKRRWSTSMMVRHIIYAAYDADSKRDTEQSTAEPATKRAAQRRATAIPPTAVPTSSVSA